MAATRTAIADKIFTTLKNDAGAGSIQALAGATGGDPRVYQGYGDAERVLDSTFPAYIIIMDITESEPFLAREGFIYQVSIFAKGRNKCRSVQDRVDALLHRKALAATGWTDLAMKRTMANATFDPSAGCWQAVNQYKITVWS